MTTSTLLAECEVPCTACGAPANALCTTKDGRPNRNPHNARRKAWSQWMTDRLQAATEAETAAVEVPVKDSLALQLLVLKVLLARVTGVDADLRAQAAKAFSVGDLVPGYLTDADRAAGTHRLGRVGLAKGRESWKVKDVEKLTAWVAEHHPEEIERRPLIRNSFLTALMASCKKHGAWVNGDGEAIDLPGVEQETGRPVLSATVSDEAEALVAAALADGTLRFDGERIAITAGGEA